MGLVIIDTGCANLSSVTFAFERVGAQPLISDDPAQIRAGERVVLPGVGAAPYAMTRLKQKGLDAVVKTLTQPVLGICLGMQLLFETLIEGGQETQGLGLIPGRVDALDTGGRPLPHMGWNQIEQPSSHALLRGVEAGDYAYFVHSFAAPVGEYTLAQTQYGTRFSSVVGRDNIFGCQFHPERSSQLGAKILENFMGLS